MANYATLKAAIQQVVKTNGNNEITGALLQQSLLAMINSLGGYYQFAGLATPSTNPGTPDQNIFYIANTAGTYSNFNSIVLSDGEIALLKYNGSWSKDSTGAASLQKVNRIESELPENFKDLTKNMAVFDMMGKDAVATTRSVGSYCQNTLHVAAPGSTYGYGIEYVEVNAGDIINPRTLAGYSIIGSYIDVFFVEQFQTGEIPVIIGSKATQNAQRSTPVDYYFVATKHGYVCISYFSNQTSTYQINKYNKTLLGLNLGDVTPNGPTPQLQKLIRAGETFEQLRSLSKKMSVLDLMNATEMSVSDQNGAWYNNNKLNIGPTGKSYGVYYVPVEQGDVVKVKTDVGYLIRDGYANVFFVEQIVDGEKGSVIGYVPITETYETQEKNYYFIAPKNGFVCASYFSTTTTLIHFYSLYGVEKINSADFLKKDVSLPFSNVGTIYYPSGQKQTGLGNSYASTDIVPISGYSKISGMLQGNNTVASVLFLDEQKQALPNLSVVISGYRAVNIDLTDAIYSSAKYIVSSIYINGYTSNISLKTGVAYESDLDGFSKKVCKYKKYSAIGDSLTNASPWINIVQTILEIESVTRAGASGLTMADVAGQNSIHGSIMAMTADADVDLISIWAGTNDYSYNVPLGDFDEQYNAATRDTTTFYGAYMDSIEHILSTFPKARLFLIGTTDRVSRPYNSSQPWTDARDGNLTKYVDATQKLAERYSLPFLDLLRTSGINKYNIWEYMFLQTYPSDNPTQEYYLHFNSGYGTQQIAQRISAFINSIG